MQRRDVPVRSLGRRLTVAFVLVAGISTAALAVASFALVRQSRLDDALRRAEVEARYGLTLAANSRFARGRPDPASFLPSYESRGVHAVLLVGDRRFSSDPRFRPPIPSDVRQLAGRGVLAYRRVETEGVPFLVVGGRPPDSDALLFMFFSEARIERDLGQLRAVLIAGWATIVVVAALVGRSLARRTLDPVTRASEAARALAEGLLDTRLPLEGTDEFGAWAASFNEMAAALEAKITALSEAEARERRFTADVAHELRTPLAALVAEASMLRDHLDLMPPPARRVAELVAHDVARLRRLVDDLMEISRLDAGKEPVALEPVDLAALVESVVRARGWTDVKMELGPARINTDPRRVERIVANVVGNAVEHAGVGIVVRVASSGDGAVVDVLDRGPGIAAADVAHLFDRFYKADPARSSAGSGLGLAIAMENAKLLGGTITVSPREGGGTRFTISIPGREATVAEPLRHGDRRVAEREEDGARHRPKGGTT